jgi:site-specific DNA-methyltransferase (adenine-specific)
LDVHSTLADCSIDFIFTDPPYGHNNNNGDLISRWEAALGGVEKQKSEWRPIANDGPEANGLVIGAMADWNRLLSPGCCCCCCCGGGGPDPQFARWSLWIDEAIGFKQMVVWDKGPMGMGWHYRRSYETVLVAEKPGAACRWFANGSDIENIIRPGFRGIAKIIPTKSEHPTPKPVELSAHFIGLHTQPGHLVLDSFMGGGSTAIACIRTGRRFIGIEIDPVHFKTACERIQREVDQFTLPLEVSTRTEKQADLFTGKEHAA